MFERIKVLDIELRQPVVDLTGLDGYSHVQVLVRLEGVPLGYIAVPVSAGHVPGEVLSQTIDRELHQPLSRQQLCATLIPQSEFAGSWPSVTVAVCTRNRPDNLARCLDALCALDYPGMLDILVIDNAPSDEASAQLVREQYPQVRYERELRPGLDWARNRAITAAHGDIVAYTDDDVIVDRHWARELARVFVENPGIMAVTGLVVPLELETEAQQAFENYGGFGRGFVQRWFSVNVAAGERAATEYTATGKFGTGANMAYRRELFARIGGFDPALDVGTTTNGGGDLEMFFRVLKAGFTLVYEPRAIVFHRHRRDEQSFVKQIANNGTGFYAYLVRCFMHFPDERRPILRQGVWWFWYWYVYRLLLSFVRPVNTTRRLILAEMRGGLLGLGRYQRARRIAQNLAEPGDLGSAITAPAQTRPDLHPEGTAVRVIDIQLPLQPLTDVTAYPRVHAIVQRDGVYIGSVNITNSYLPIGRVRLAEAIVDQLGHALLRRETNETVQSSTKQATASVVITTTGQSAFLQTCLESVVAQRTEHLAEVIVVDRHPQLGHAAQIVATFPGVHYISEYRSGMSFVCNHSMTASIGSIIVMLCDDVVVPYGWLERVLMPFQRDDMAAVVATELPLELESYAQRLREQQRASTHVPTIIHGGTHSDTVPWQLARAACMAFRASLFTDSGDGMLNEAPGVGMEVGAESYFFHRLLAAGYNVCVEPQAYVWRRDNPSMKSYLHDTREAVSSYVAYLLTRTVQEQSVAPLVRSLVTAPYIITAKVLSRIKTFLRGREILPFAILGAELAGIIRAPFVVYTAQRHKLNEQYPVINPEALERLP